MRAAILAGRILFALIFVLSGFNHFKHDTIAYAASAGVPAANVLVPLAGILAMVSGLMIAFGFFTRLGAIGLLVFLIPVTFKMHAFWNVSDPMMHQMQMVNFLKNLALMGGSLAFLYFGAGALSIDQHFAPGRTWWRKEVHA